MKAFALMVVWGTAAGLVWMGTDLARAQAAPAAEALYQQHCAGCHGAERFGAMGPALLPESLERLRKAEALKVIGEVTIEVAGCPLTLAVMVHQVSDCRGWVALPKRAILTAA